MKKAAHKEAVQLGTKRTCPKCSLKFYDFAKAEIHCPKCQTAVDPESERQAFKQAVEKKSSKPKGIMRDDDEDAVTPASDAFESVEDLGDDDDSDLDAIAPSDDGDSDDN